MFAVGVTGCDEFSARRAVQNGNKLFKDGKFEEAAKEFEAAVAKAPDLDIAHHNLALTYSKLFSPGLDTPENKAFADKAATHFAAYLKSHPKDNQIRDMMTKTWLDADEFEKALSYWQAEHEKEPASREIIQKMAGINLKAGRWAVAMDWYDKEAAMVNDPAAKISALMSIGYVGEARTSSRQTAKPLVGDERLFAADRAIAALQKVLELDPKHPNANGILGAVYSARALTHGAAWAAGIDRATALNHSARQRVISEEIKKNQTPPAGTPATPSKPGDPAAPVPAAAPAATTDKATGAPATGG